MARGKHKKKAELRRQTQQENLTQQLQSSIETERQRCQALEAELPTLESLTERISAAERRVEETWLPRIDALNGRCLALWKEIKALESELEELYRQRNAQLTGSRRPALDGKNFERVARAVSEERGEPPLTAVETSKGVYFMTKRSKAEEIRQIAKARPQRGKHKGS